MEGTVAFYIENIIHYIVLNYCSIFTILQYLSDLNHQISIERLKRYQLHDTVATFTKFR
jgi:hypothetical protein